MADKHFRYVGEPDFHDGYVRAVNRTGNSMLVIVEGSSGKRYSVKFDGVTSLESCSPENMMLHALAEWESGLGALHLYDFINWHHDEPEEDASKSFLRISAEKFSITSE